MVSDPIVFPVVAESDAIGRNVAGDFLDDSAAAFAFFVEADDAFVCGVFADEADGVSTGGEFFDICDEDAGYGGVVGVNEAKIAGFECPDLGPGGVGDL